MTGRPSRYVSGLPRPDHPLVMGVVNVTPDSFSDGGSWFEPAKAVAHGLDLIADGADILDVGGESTRPGAERPPLQEELRRVIPVVRDLCAAGAIVSVDTMRAEVAEQAVAAGARIINDVSGGLADDAMLRLAADANVAYICMHWRGHSTVMEQRTRYRDVVADVVAELRPRVEAARAAGITEGRLILDPGLGFAKDAEHNWTLLNHLDELDEFGCPLLVAASRKRFLGLLLADPVSGEPRAPEGRDVATAAVSVFAYLHRVWCVRVHDVRPTMDALAVAARMTDRAR
jgi:dihydropteroate synthase